MTGILRINAYDTDTKQRYLLIASDSQTSKRIGGKIVKEGDTKKIYLLENHLFAGAGTSLINDEVEVNKLKKLLFSDSLDKHKVKVQLMMMDYLHKNNNIYFVADKKNLEFDDLGNKKIIIYGPAWATIGSGREYIAEVLKELPKDKIVKMPMKDLLEISYMAINNAAKHNEDSFTGGFFSFGAVGEKQSNLELNLKKL